MAIINTLLKVVNKARRKIIRFVFCLVIPFWIIMPCISFANNTDATAKKKITALYLYNFLLFVDWPEGAFSNSNVMKVGILGDPKLYEAMKSMSGKKIKGKRLMIISMTPPQSLNEYCHVMFVGDIDKDTVKQLLGNVGGKPVLTLSDRRDFTALGGMVAFKDPASLFESETEHKRFIINLTAVRRSGLRIRSRLLRMSDVVDDPKIDSSQRNSGSHRAP